MLSETELATFRELGHVTISDVLTTQQIDEAIDDITGWSAQFLSELSDERSQWYLEGTPGSGTTTLRKLDNPVYHRDVFRSIAQTQRLISSVRQLIGQPVTAFFSQVFLKPPEVGGPKPVHQDNFYFGPDDQDATLTAWIAIDDATTENGCLFFADGSHKGPVLQHEAPEDEPFNLQISETDASQVTMTPAPVDRGGVSFHHGNTWHQSSANTSPRPRRAVAIHFLRSDARLVSPALKYDPTIAIPF